MLKYLSWFGTLVSIFGAFAVASQIVFPGYVLFSLGSISWLTVGFFRRDNALCVLNGTFFLANLLGLYNAFWNIEIYFLHSLGGTCCHNPVHSGIGRNPVWQKSHTGAPKLYHIILGRVKGFLRESQKKQQKYIFVVSLDTAQKTVI